MTSTGALAAAPAAVTSAPSVAVTTTATPSAAETAADSLDADLSVQQADLVVPPESQATDLSVQSDEQVEAERATAEARPDSCHSVSDQVSRPRR